MECIFIPEIVKDNLYTSIDVVGDEARHLTALRLFPKDSVLVSNGKGFIAECSIKSREKNRFTLNIESDVTSEFPENLHSVSLFISPLSSNDRTEFIIEKATELGVNTIQLIRTENSEFKSIRYERLKLKAIAALKQSKRAYLPEIKNVISFNSTLSELKNYTKTFLGSVTGDTIFEVSECFQNLEPNSSLAVIVGPEGGLSETELNELDKLENIQQLKVGNHRLRSETAAIALLSIIAGV